MDSSTRIFIDNLAEAVIDAYGITIPIDNIEDVVKKIGGEIVEKADLDDLYDGTIRKVDQSSFSIVISPFQSEGRKDFTVEHELGHLFLHMGFGVDPDLWSRQNDTIYRRFGTSEQEYQANEFAAALLMPQKEYLSELLRNKTDDGKVCISEIADYFHVSNAAAGNRGKFLGYLI